MYAFSRAVTERASIVSERLYRKQYSRQVDKDKDPYGVNRFEVWVPQGTPAFSVNVQGRLLVLLLCTDA